MRYVLAKADRAEAAGFGRETHNTVTVDGIEKMVITAKGMNAAASLKGGEADRLEALGGTVYENQKQLEDYLYNHKIRKK